ncbi:c-type cytochrome [Candidatus Manganitrophus noduliformans]|uniref:c-type cytochrome n=1 Tax=Candidatus Manganitrophus noduliformans TaxID=2606439 RepID=UPI002A4E16DC|nr:c-type cytochrome [Candidatus Manganitrophus noduliformans]
MSLLFFLFFTAALSVQGASPKKESPSASTPSKPNPSEGKRIFNHYCAVCHGVTAKGNGVNAESLDPTPADLTSGDVQGLTDEEIYEVIDLGGGYVELSVAMPPWGKTLSGEQISDLVAYIRTFSEDAPEPEKGVRLSDVRRGDRSDCQICHMKQGQIRPIAPNLGHEGSKLNPEWLSKFLKDPEKIRPVGFIPLTKSKMPDFQLSDEEVSALTAFLMTQKDGGVSAAPLAGLNLSDPAEIEKGRRFFIDKYACDACHKGAEIGGIVGPDLSSTAERIKPEWVYFWLKNPQAIRPDVAMPNFGIPDSEIRSLIAYIYSLGGGASQAAKVSGETPSDPALIKKGEKLIKDKNCLACHTMDSFNSQERRQEKGKEQAAAPRS